MFEIIGQVITTTFYSLQYKLTKNKIKYRYYIKYFKFSIIKLNIQIENKDENSNMSR